MKTKRWRTTGSRCFGPQVREECKSKITPITLSEDVEPGPLQGALVAIAIRDCTQARSRCPGHRKGEVTRSRSHHIINAKDRPRSQYAGNLVRKFLLVLNVHPDVQHIRPVKASFGERQG